MNTEITLPITASASEHPASHDALSSVVMWMRGRGLLLAVKCWSVSGDGVETWKNCHFITILLQIGLGKLVTDVRHWRESVTEEGPEGVAGRDGEKQCCPPERTPESRDLAAVACLMRQGCEPLPLETARSFSETLG